MTGRMAHVAESAGRCCSPTGRYTGSSMIRGWGGRRDWLAWLDGGTACSCPGLSKTLELPLGCFWDALVCRLIASPIIHMGPTETSPAQPLGLTAKAIRDTSLQSCDSGTATLRLVTAIDP